MTYSRILLSCCLFIAYSYAYEQQCDQRSPHLNIPGSCKFSLITYSSIMSVFSHSILFSLTSHVFFYIILSLYIYIYVCFLHPLYMLAYYLSSLFLYFSSYIFIYQIMASSIPSSIQQQLLK